MEQHSLCLPSANPRADGDGNGTGNTFLISLSSKECKDRDRRPNDAPSAPHRKEDVVKSEWRPQQSDPSPQPWSSRNIEDFNLEMRQVWEWEMQEEHFAISCRAYELSAKRGCKDSCDREDWFRAESELHLTE